jgi:Predicted membrane protein (DUF2232)
MKPSLFIGLAGGLASAVLFASATAGHPSLRLVLFFLAPLPAFLAGLGWGTVAAAVSAVSASAACAVILGPRSGGVLMLSQGLPIVLLCYLAQLSRAGGAAAGTSAPDRSSIEWYPVGRLIAVAVAIAGLLAFLTTLLMGDSVEEMRKVLRELLDKVFLQQLPVFQDRAFSEAEKVALTEIMLYAFPAASSLSWLAGLLLNFYLAGRITLASGRLPRPWPDLAAITYPRGFAIGLGLSLASTVSLQGFPALLASGFAGAFFLAYLLLGLAIAHYITRGLKGRPIILWALYIGLLFLNTWAGLALALLGALEPILPFRRWKSRGPPAASD